MKKDKRTNGQTNDLQNTTQKIEDWATQTSLKSRIDGVMVAAASAIDRGSERKSA
jgi:hypothetical protein